MACTVTENNTGPVKLIKFAWTSDAAGDATGVTGGKYNGKVEFVATDPGATAPTDDYDITVTDENGLDVLLGNGANRDTAVTEYIATGNLGCVVESTLTLTVANAGDTKQGAVYVYVR